MSRESGKQLNLDEGTCIFGAGILLKHVEALDEELASILGGEKDIEYIHRARVASRRLRAALPLFDTCLPKRKSRVWLKQIRNVTRSLGEARDTDVQIERLNKILKIVQDKASRPGILRLILRLKQHRDLLQPNVVKSVQALVDANVLEQMSQLFSSLSSQASTVYIYTPGLYQHGFQSITARLDEFLAYESFIEQPEKIKELHEMRIHAKWLRYTTESFSSLYSNELKTSLQVIRQVQELLGDIHDCDVWNEYLPRFQDEELLRCREYFGHTRFFGRLIPGIHFLIQNRAMERNQLYEQFVKGWQEWRAENKWEDLRQAVQVPFSNPGSFFPPLTANEISPQEA